MGCCSASAGLPGRGRGGSRLAGAAARSRGGASWTLFVTVDAGAGAARGGRGAGPRQAGAAQKTGCRWSCLRRPASLATAPNCAKSPAMRPPCAYCEWVVRLAPLYKRSGQKLTLSPSVTARFSALARAEPRAPFAPFGHRRRSGGSASGEVELQLGVLDSAVGLCGRVPAAGGGAGRPAHHVARGCRASPPPLSLPLGSAMMRWWTLLPPGGASRRTARAVADAAARLCLRKQAPRRTQLPLLLDGADRRAAAAPACREHALQSAALPVPPGRTAVLQSASPSCSVERCSARWISRCDVLHKSLRGGRQSSPRRGGTRSASIFDRAQRRASRHAAALCRGSSGAQSCADPAGNQRWLSRAGAPCHRRLARPRRRELELAGQRYVPAIEEDPIEVLRMGIPFGTCLSLTDSSNAAAAVCNAWRRQQACAVYLRDRRGVIVGRKLLSISGAFELLGYELYLALPPELRPPIAAAVSDLCLELAQAARIPFSAVGVPERYTTVLVR